jgi:hypothetical protein
MVNTQMSRPSTIGVWRSPPWLLLPRHQLRGLNVWSGNHRLHFQAIILSHLRAGCQQGWRLDYPWPVRYGRRQPVDSGSMMSVPSMPDAGAPHDQCRVPLSAVSAGSVALRTCASWTVIAGSSSTIRINSPGMIIYGLSSKIPHSIPMESTYIVARAIASISTAAPFGRAAA